MMTSTKEYNVSRQCGRGLIVFLLIVTTLAVAPQDAVAQTLDDLRSQNWHQWRGPEASGVSRTGCFPSSIKALEPTDLAFNVKDDKVL